MAPRKVSDAEFKDTFRKLAEEQENQCGVIMAPEFREILLQRYDDVLLYEATADFLVIKVKGESVWVFPKMHGKKCECFTKESEPCG